MDEDVFNMQVRKFLKNVGVTSQREIETAVREALASGKLSSDESVSAKVTLTIDGLGLSTDITGTIDLK
jgi:ribosomal protein L1